nr:immunoglobulin heavy chain junction region [Macaca mulatta]MPN70264.1 immunoglobulin heavy chain junction region [Macaca mulatta]MPN71568.1 immunoglobulin heavy chain junction region [Macaca mulatta]MPN72208.1 immunoglobulin heavy chain junction region [Macaca mulatta]MPN72345.1 immunoglobulin heavy chain junction region [Macaca mulatta]
CYTEGDCW